jgi:mannose-6-phosphate isomerase-like protein (cupin superfamily)
MFKTNIEKDTLKNTYYRKVLYTNKNQQLVLMSLNPGEYLPLEKHNGSQFFNIVSGVGYAVASNKKTNLKDNYIIIIPPNTNHTFYNTSTSKSLKLYTIYSPPQHKPMTLHKRQKNDDGT